MNLATMGRAWQAGYPAYRRLGLAILCMLFVAGHACADLRVDVKMEHAAVLQFEPAFAHVTVENDGGTAFVFDKRGLVASLRFHIRSGDDNYVSALAEGPIVTDRRVEPGEQGQFMVDLTRWYDLREERRYFVQAEIVWHEQSVLSKPVSLSVVPGIEMKKVQRSLFDSGIVRTYSLRYWAREQGEVLFLRVDEAPSGRNYGVFRLGSVVRVYDPEIKADPYGRIEVLHQSAAGVYTHSEFHSGNAGVEFIKQTLVDKNMRPLDFTQDKPVKVVP